MADKAWADMTADEKRAWRIDKWRNPGITVRQPRGGGGLQGPRAIG